MKAPSVIFTLALSLAAPLALAQQDQDHQVHHPETSAPGETTAMPTPLQQRLERMQTIVDKLAETDDPLQRRKLMEEHRQAMQETRSMMGGSQGGMGMMGGGMGMMGANQGGMGMMGGGMGMMGADQGGMGMMGGQSGMMPMMQRMQEMQAGMDEILNTEDSTKRMELMKEHRRQMQEAMGMMRGMQQGGGGMGMMGGGMGMMGKGAMPMKQHQGQAGMLEAFRQMDKRLDLMQQMLEQLMEKQD